MFKQQVNDGNLRNKKDGNSMEWLIFNTTRTKNSQNLEEDSNIGHGTAASKGYRCVQFVSENNYTSM